MNDRGGIESACALRSHLVCGGCAVSHVALRHGTVQ